jgi:hypothetical protein
MTILPLNEEERQFLHDNAQYRAQIADGAIKSMPVGKQEYVEATFRRVFQNERFSICMTCPHTNDLFHALRQLFNRYDAEVPALMVTEEEIENAGEEIPEAAKSNRKK